MQQLLPLKNTASVILFYLLEAHILPYKKQEKSMLNRQGNTPFAGGLVLPFSLRIHLITKKSEKLSSPFRSISYFIFPVFGKM